MKQDAIKTLRTLNRDSANGLELSVYPVYESSTVWSYRLMRYTLTLEKQFSPAEQIQDFSGWTWDAIADFCADYLKNTDTTSGFYFA